MSPTECHRQITTLPETSFQSWGNKHRIGQPSIQPFSQDASPQFSTHTIRQHFPPWSYKCFNYQSPLLNDYNSLSLAKLDSTRGTATTERQIYRANQQWVSILLTTSLILAILVLARIVLEFLIQGPDVLGFASSMTRDNPYVSVTPGGTALDRPDRARVLRHLRVQLADVYPGNDMGYIALKNVPPVERGRTNRISATMK